MQPISSPLPRVFRNSLDWRFLLPVSDPAQVYIACEEDPALSEALDRIGIPAANRFSLASFERSTRQELSALVLPFGLPADWVSAGRDDQVGFYRAIRQMLCPGGYLLLGFENVWSSRSKARYRASTPARAADRLEQAGFQTIKIFGVMPDLHIPEYIFDLHAQALDFALQHRFRRKPVVLNMLHALRLTVGLASVSNFLPSYFAVATA